MSWEIREQPDKALPALRRVSAAWQLRDPCVWCPWPLPQQRLPMGIPSCKRSAFPRRGGEGHSDLLPFFPWESWSSFSTPPSNGSVPPARRMGRERDPMERGTAAQLRRENGAGGSSGPSCMFSYKAEEQLLFSSPRTPVCST